MKRLNRGKLIALAIVATISTSAALFTDDLNSFLTCQNPVPVLTTNYGYGSHHGRTYFHQLGDVIEITASIPGCSKPMSAWDWHVQSAGGLDDEVTRTEGPAFSVTLDTFAPMYIYVIPITEDGEELVHWQNSGAIHPQVALHDIATLTPSNPVYEFTAPFACCPRAFSASLRFIPTTVPNPEVTARLLRENGEVLFEGRDVDLVMTRAELEEKLGTYWLETLTWRIETDNTIPVGYEVSLRVDIETYPSILPASN